MVVLGRIARFVFIAIVAILLAYQIPDIRSQPIGTLTLGELMTAAGFVVMAGLCVRWAFLSIEDERAAAWGAAALIVGALTGLAILYFAR